LKERVYYGLALIMTKKEKSSKKEKSKKHEKDATSKPVSIPTAAPTNRDIPKTKDKDNEKAESNKISSRTYKISSVSPVKISNNELVTVKFETDSPSSLDWIAAYSPADVDVKKATPVLYSLCSGIPPTNNENLPKVRRLESSGGNLPSQPVNDYLHSGIGEVRFNFTNIRSSIKFYYFNSNRTFPLTSMPVASSTEIVSFKNPNELFLNRIIPGKDVNSYRLLWSSANSHLPYLRWGIFPGQYPFLSNGTISRINRQDLCGTPANTTGYFDLGMINEASFGNITEQHLLGNTVIYYIFGDHSFPNDHSKEFQFLLPPIAGELPSKSSDPSTTLAIIGDLGVSFPISSKHPSTTVSSGVSFWDGIYPPAIDTVLAIEDQVRKNQINGLLHVGDLSYANGYLSVWYFYLNMLSPIISRIPYLTVVGNHEVDDIKEHYSLADSNEHRNHSTSSELLYPETHGSGGECGVVFSALFPMPTKNTIETPWWSYETGLFHVIGMSSEHDYHQGSRQYQWIEKDLQSINYLKTPWVVLLSHRGMYVSSQQCCEKGSDVDVMKSYQSSGIEELIHKYHVNLFIAGHFHNLQRQSAVYHNHTLTRTTMAKASRFTFPSNEPAEMKLNNNDQSDEDNDNNNKNSMVRIYNHPEATIHTIIGSSGAGPTMSDGKYPWSEQSWNQQFGYATITAHNASVLEWKIIEGKTKNVLDQVYLLQEAPTVANPPPAWTVSKGNINVKDLAEQHIIHRNINILIRIVLFVLIVTGLSQWILRHSSRWSFWGYFHREGNNTPNSAGPLNEEEDAEKQAMLPKNETSSIDTSKNTITQGYGTYDQASKQPSIETDMKV
jgi:hypothetical protein